MTTVTLSEARASVVRDRVLAGVAEVLQGGEALTFAAVAKAAAVSERTVYRHFATREELLAAVHEWINAQLGLAAERPTTLLGLQVLLRRAFPGFDAFAPVVRELLVAPEGRAARLAQNANRRRAMQELVRGEAPHLDAPSSRRLAAALQVLTAAATWQTLRDYWDMDGTEAAETSALAAELLLAGARTRRSARATTPKRPAPKEKKK